MATQIEILKAEAMRSPAAERVLLAASLDEGTAVEAPLFPDTVRWR